MCSVEAQYEAAGGASTRAREPHTPNTLVCGRTLTGLPCIISQPYTADLYSEEEAVL